MNEITKCGVARCSESLEYSSQQHKFDHYLNDIEKHISVGFSFIHCGWGIPNEVLNDINFWESING